MDDREQRRICESKQRHAIEGEAETMAKRARRKGYRDADQLRAYECPVCRGWHLSHRPALVASWYRPSPAMIAAQGGRS